MFFYFGKLHPPCKAWITRSLFFRFSQIDHLHSINHRPVQPASKWALRWWKWKHLLTARLPEDIKDAPRPRGELVLISLLLTHHLRPTLQPQKQVASVTWKQYLWDPKKLPYLQPCHAVIFHPTFSVYWAHAPLQTHGPPRKFFEKDGSSPVHDWCWWRGITRNSARSF